MTEDMNKHLFPPDPDPVEDLDVHMELRFSRKNLPKGEMVPVLLDGKKEYVLIPLDIKDGTTLPVVGRGKHNPRTGKTGNLYVLVHIEEKTIPWKVICISAALLVLIIAGICIMLKKPTLPPPPITEATAARQTEKSCVHDWIPADCTKPSTCRICRETKGNPAGHLWTEATYDTPKTCRICGETEGNVIKKSSQFTDMYVGKTIQFGSYEQDGNKGNGTEMIEWIVLDVQVDKALLLSRYALDSMPYNNEYEPTTWENCDLRNWLNSSFIRAAFTSDEQKTILLSTIDNGAAQGHRKWNNQSENDTQDRVFLLSYAETNDYFNGNEDRICYLTNYADSKRENVPDVDTDAGWWWLRSPGEAEHHAAFVNFDGTRYYNAVGNEYLSVRPALWISLDGE